MAGRQANNNQTITIKTNIIFEIKSYIKVTYVTQLQCKANKKKRIRIKIHNTRDRR